MIKVIAFDVFGTVFDLSKVDKQEIRDYVGHIRESEWSPLKLPGHWEELPAHPDAKEGIDLLRREFIVVTMSNGPAALLAKLSKFNNISWDMIVPIELRKVYKPNPAAYMLICDMLDVDPHEVLMVTANKTFGDLEAAASLGMRSMLIRDESSDMKDIKDLAEYFVGIPFDKLS
jgi:2-haloalkanoic acid dehalogenase type II